LVKSVHDSQQLIDVLYALALPDTLPEDNTVAALCDLTQVQQQQIWQFNALIRLLDQQLLLPLLDLALPLFSDLKRVTQQKVIAQLAKILTPQPFTSFKFCLWVLLKKRVPRLGLNLSITDSTVAISSLIGMLCQQTRLSEAEQANCYLKVLKDLPLKTPPEFSRVAKLNIIQLNLELSKLNKLNAKYKARLLQHATELLRKDMPLAQVQQLLRGIAEALESPVPPLA
jgi:hypothetical protein